MMHWPQISVLVWLVAALCSSLGAASRPPRGWIVLTGKQQRIAAAGFAAATLTEAFLLTAGGFFKEIF